jgi:hypothetical protein
MNVSPRAQPLMQWVRSNDGDSAIVQDWNCAAPSQILTDCNTMRYGCDKSMCGRLLCALEQNPILIGMGLGSLGLLRGGNPAGQKPRSGKKLTAIGLFSYLSAVNMIVMFPERAAIDHWEVIHEEAN